MSAIAANILPHRVTAQHFPAGVILISGPILLEPAAGEFPLWASTANSWAPTGVFRSSHGENVSGKKDEKIQSAAKAEKGDREGKKECTTLRTIDCFAYFASQAVGRRVGTRKF